MSVNSQYYVDAVSGDDTNDGSSSLPFKTIQKAFDIVSINMIDKNVTINVAAGTYIERTNYNPTLFQGDYRVNVLGETVLIDSGTSTSQISYSQSSGNIVTAKLVDNSAAFTVNEHQKRFLHITGGSGFDSNNDELNWYVIRDNNSNSISICGDFNKSLSNNSTYDIVSLNTVIDGTGEDSCMVLRGDRLSVKNIKMIDSSGFTIAGMDSSLNMFVACHFEGANNCDSNFASIKGGLRALSCYFGGNGNSIKNNIAFFEAFGIGDYDEEFLTSAAFTNSKTGIKGCFIDGGKNGVQFSGCHTRLTGNYFTNQENNALEIGRMSSLSIYGNDMTGLKVLIADQSYLKIHSGNKIQSITNVDSTIYKQNAGGWFTALVDLITIEKNSPIYGTSFNAVTEIYNPVAARIYNSVNQSVANIGVIGLIYNSNRYLKNVDRVGSTLVIKEAGFYMLGVHCCFDTDNTGTKRVLRLKANSTYIAIDDNTPLTGIQTILNVTTGYYLQKNDVISADVSHNATGSLNVLSLGNWTSELWVAKVF